MTAVMEISNDDVMYRVDAVWLGPPKATFPWRARYVSWGIGLVCTLLVLGVLRLWFPFGFFTLGWSLVIGVGITRLIGRKITHERPLRDVARMAVRELTTPRQTTTPTGGAANPSVVRIREHRPTPRHATSRRSVDHG
jgi:hypothetical protein